MTTTTTPPTLNPLLQYSQHGREQGHCCPLLWDVRESPRSARHLSALDRTLSDFELSQHATSPTVTSMRLVCGIFPEESWTIEARNWLGITIRDVLEEITATVTTQITYAEWDKLCQKQQNRVNVMFDARWRRSEHPTQVHDQGIIRADCLLQHVVFAGLSLAPQHSGMQDTYILTLGRPKR
ncbi:ectomycorrhiza-regulated small secreted protein, partial [Roridomyces roridus]